MSESHWWQTFWVFWSACFTVDRSKFRLDLSWGDVLGHPLTPLSPCLHRPLISAVLLNYSQTLLTRQTRHAKVQDGFPPVHFTSLSRQPCRLPSPQHGCDLPCVNWPVLLAIWLSSQHWSWRVTTLALWDCQLSCKTPAVVTLYQSAAVLLSVCHSRTQATLLLHLRTAGVGWPGHTALVVVWQHLSLPSCLSAHAGIQLGSTCQPNRLTCHPHQRWAGVS